jgi:hypothetical protein
MHAVGGGPLVRAADVASRLIAVLGILGVLTLVALPGATCTVSDDNFGCPLDDRWEAEYWSPASFSWRQVPGGEPVLGMHLWVDGTWSDREPLYTFSTPTVSGATLLSSVMDASRFALTLQPFESTVEVVVRLPIDCDGTEQVILFSVVPGEPDPLQNHLDYGVTLE